MQATHHTTSSISLQRRSLACTSTPRPSSIWRRSQQGQQTGRRVVVVSAKDKSTGNAALDNALEIGGNLVDSAANLVPDSVPRGVAKGGVAVVGALLVFTLLQKLVSTVLTIALLGGAAWFYFNYGGSSGSGSSGDSSSKSTSGSSKDVDLNDPLAEARRIMDKYKK